MEDVPCHKNTGRARNCSYIRSSWKHVRCQTDSGTSLCGILRASPWYVLATIVDELPLRRPRRRRHLRTGACVSRLMGTSVPSTGRGQRAKSSGAKGGRADEDMGFGMIRDLACDQRRHFGAPVPPLLHRRVEEEKRAQEAAARWRQT